MNYISGKLLILMTFFSFNTSCAQDWANLKRYQKENAVLSIPEPGENRIVFMGNSITEGWLSLNPEFFKGKPYINRGIGGQTSPQMLHRFKQDVIDLQPSVVVILAGINDIAENTGPITIEKIADNIFSMVELAKSNNIVVLICSVLPANEFGWRKGLAPAEKVLKLNAILRSYAVENEIEYVDYYTSMVDDSLGLKKELGSDSVHPNAKGYSVMEPILEDALFKVLKLK